MPDGGGCFGWAEPAVVPGLVQGAEEGVDGQHAVVDVEVVAVQAGEFAPAAAGPGGGDDQQIGHPAAELAGLFGDINNLFRGSPDPFRHHFA